MTDQNLQSLTETTTPTSDALVYIVDNPNVSPSDRKVTLTNLFKGGGGREILTADRIYYVRTDGSDTNTGLVNTAGGAFLTLQKAVTKVLTGINLGGYNVTIQLGDGTYVGPTSISAPWDGNGTVTIKGNNASPDNVKLSVTSANQEIILVDNNSRLVIQDLQLLSLSGNAKGLSANNNSNISFSNITFDCSVGMKAYNGSSIVALSNYRIYSTSSPQTSHLLASRSLIQTSQVTCTITGTPSFSYFVNAADSIINVASTTYSGSATGARYYLVNSRVISNGTFTSFETLFPGSTKGTQDATSILGTSFNQNIMRVTSPFAVTSSTVLTNVTTASEFYVKAGGTYIIEIEMFTTSNVAGGVKAALGGSATATSIVYTGTTTAGSTSTTTRATALATAVGAVTAVTDAHISIKGYFVVNATGVVRMMFAQNVSNGAASTVLAGSYMRITEVA